MERSKCICSCSTQSLIVQRNPVTVDHRTANLAASKGAVKKGGREGRGKERKGQHVGEKLVGRTEGTIEQQSSIMKVMAICTVRRSQTRRRTDCGCPWNLVRPSLSANWLFGEYIGGKPKGGRMLDRNSSTIKEVEAYNSNGRSSCYRVNLSAYGVFHNWPQKRIVKNLCSRVRCEDVNNCAVVNSCDPTLVPLGHHAHAFHPSPNLVLFSPPSAAQILMLRARTHARVRTSSVPFAS